MSSSPPAGYPRISPYLNYEDTGAMIVWLARAFGLVERHRLAGPDGAVTHAEMALEEGVVMMGSPGGDFRNRDPYSRAHSLERAERRWQRLERGSTRTLQGESVPKRLGARRELPGEAAGTSPRGDEAGQCASRRNVPNRRSRGHAGRFTPRPRPARTPVRV